MDFASYLLSSSPPGFELNYTIREQFGLGLNRPMPRTVRARTTPGLNGPAKAIHKTHSLPDLREGSAKDESNLKGGCRLREAHSDEDVDVDPSPLQRPKVIKPPQKNGIGKKRVSFADDVGMNLVSIRLLTESSDTPPVIRPQVLQSLSQGSSVPRASPLMLNFSQPASNYMAFREKIEKDCVSLENVILKDYLLIGTIKVKNIAFEKLVKVRCTFDSWETSQDFVATYVPNGQNAYDTFSFEIRVPPTMDVRKKVQFCVCFVANGQEYWDSNSGSNYEVVSSNWKSVEASTASQNTTDKSVFSLDQPQDWTQFSGWNNMDSSCPYW